MDNIEPSKREVDLYLEKFLMRYKLTMKDFKTHSINTENFS